MFRTSRFSILGLATAFGALVSTQSDDAQACGGLFCNNSNPVNQAAERIIFADNGDGSVTAAIEIQYQGPSESFAWVLPVPPGEIEVGVSSKVALDRLDSQTNPTYRLNRIFDPECGDIAFAGGSGFGAPVAANDAESAPEPSPEPDVVVLEEGSAGPYDYQRIAVNPDLEDPAQVAVDWLTENGYDLGELGPDLLRPYLEGQMDLLAFRLTKGNDAGSVRPVMITYQAEQPFIPIRPTAVAAVEDMGVKVWVLGDSRAIPENYLHLELNESLINWFNPNLNYNDVIIAAANEAGGQGFVTEQAGPAAQFAQLIYSDSDDSLWEQLRTGQFQSIEQFMQTAVSYFGSYDGFVDVLKDDVVPLREGATAEQFVACVSCYFQEDVAVRNEAYPSTDFDPETDPLLAMSAQDFLAKMDELVIGPLQDTKALFDASGTVTRMYTTLSPDEMTVDPAFAFNAELEDVSNQHVADQIMQCTEDGREWRIELPQGMTLEGDGVAWPVTLDSDMPANLRIIQLSTSGGGVAVEDNAAVIGGLLTDLGIGEASPELMEAPGPDPVEVDPEIMDPDMDPEVMEEIDPDEMDPTPVMMGEPATPSGMQEEEDADGDVPVPEERAEDEEAEEGDEPSEEPAEEIEEEGDEPAEEVAEEIPEEGGASDDGCGCATVGKSSPVNGSWAWVGLLGLAALRRRRHG
jgi:MYXO-CTERM domain-containing protein